MVNLEHRPLTIDDDVPDKRVLGPKSLEQIFSTNIIVDSIIKEKTGTKKPTSKTNNQEPISHEQLDESNRQKDLVKSSHKYNTNSPNIIASKIIDTSDTRSVDIPNSEIQFKEFNECVRELERRKTLLSDFDTTGSTILMIIKALKSINIYLKENERKESEAANFVPEEDETYRISSMVIFNICLNFNL